MYLLPVKGISHWEADFSLISLSFSPLVSLLAPTRSAITPNRNCAILFFTSSSITHTSFLLFWTILNQIYPSVVAKRRWGLTQSRRHSQYIEWLTGMIEPLRSFPITSTVGSFMFF